LLLLTSLFIKVNLLTDKGGQMDSKYGPYYRAIEKWKDGFIGIERPGLSAVVGCVTETDEEGFMLVTKIGGATTTRYITYSSICGVYKFEQA
jgi:hypothetical protein